jgi:hypothetical protein
VGLQPFTFVCDPGVDDVVALAVLVGAGRAPARVVATAGNVTSAVAGRVAAGACALLRVDVPVLLAPGGSATRAGSRHGDDGFVGLADRLPAGEPTIPMDDLSGDLLVTAPLTVVADAATRGRVLWQGGGFNEDADPAAAAAVECDVVPVDVAGSVTVDAGELAGPALLVEAVRRYGPVLHDAVAAVAWYRPELFTWERRRAIDVDAEAVRSEIGSVLRRLT